MSLSLLASAAQAADTSATSAFPDLPYAKRWVFKPGSAGKSNHPGKPNRPSDGRTALSADFICTVPDRPCNGDIGDYYNEAGGWDTAFEGGMAVDAVLQRVYVGGFAQTPGWTVVCRGSECREYRDTIPNVMDVSPAGLQEFIVERTVGDSKADACATAQRSTLADDEKRNAIRTTTSRNDEAARKTAAEYIAEASGLVSSLSGQFATLGIGPSAWLHRWAYRVNGGYTITITFSDGGTEQYKYALLSPSADILRVVPNSLKPGDGQSRCPAN